MRSHGHVATACGRRRAHSEDAHHVDDAVGIYAVADGAGGHAYGEVAASAAVREAAQRAAVAVSTLDAETLCDGHLVEIAREIVSDTGREIHRLATMRPGFAGMGAALTLTLVHGQRLAVGHVGHTRCFFARGASVGRLTQVGLRSGAEPRTLAELGGLLGQHPECRIDAFELELLPGDWIVLATDGLGPDDDIESMLVGEARGDPSTKAAQLLRSARCRDGRDDATVVAIEITGAADLERTRRIEAEDAALAATTLAAGLPWATRIRARALATRSTLDREAVLFERGERVDRSWCVVDGILRTVGTDGDCADETTHRWTRGDAVAELAVVRPFIAAATVSAAIPTALLAISHRAIAQAPGSLAVELTATLAASWGRERDRRLIGEPSR